LVDGLGNSDADLRVSRDRSAVGVGHRRGDCRRLGNSVFRGVALIFAFHTHSVGGFFWQLLLAIAYGIAGLVMLLNPLLGLVTLTLVLAVFLLIEAALETALYFQIRRATNAGWVLFDAIITLVLAILIWSQWPSSSGWVLGMLVGISLIFSGISRLMLSTAIRRRS
jgi:uncharacterized membrane protein HdeD (DUF308 family)